MTERTENPGTNPVVARVVLAAFVAFAVAVFGLPQGLGGGFAQAQSSPSPSPTGPRIAFLNPSGTPSNGPNTEISAKNDNVNTTYHLVAWVSQVPPNATVEFKYQSGSNPDQTIATGTLRGSDTYDAEWNLAGVDDGSYQLKVILFSGTQEVSRDEKTVKVNNASDPLNPIDQQTSEPQGETVEMTYPTQTGFFGAFRKPGTNEQYKGVVDVSVSDDTTNVRAYYTVSPPGVVPEWTACHTGSGESKTASEDGVRCTLAAGVDPTRVTAIATVADGAEVAPAMCQPDRSCGDGPGSGDAHRATGYVQTPSSVTITPSTQRKDDANAEAEGHQFPCSDPIAATLFDQSGRKVAGANMDVHAAFPTDNLFFDQSRTERPNQPPNSNHPQTEATVNCASTAEPKAFGNTNQGKHDVPGEGDIKHVETQETGTDDSGSFRFILHNRSATLTGTTQFSAFFDRDDDDRQCSEEPRGNGSIGWGTDPAGPSGLPDDTTTCPQPTASPTGTASPTATATPTSTSSPTASPTPGTSRTVTLVSSERRIRHGQRVTLSGRIVSSDQSCTDNEFVRIRKRTHGTNSFSNFRSTLTDEEGNYEVTFRPAESSDYRAVAPSHDNCRDSASDPDTVLVRVRVTATANSFRVQRGDNVKILGKVIPDHARSRVVLQRKKGQRWVRVTRTNVNKNSRYRFTITANWRRARVFRVRWPGGQHRDHATGLSRNLRIRSRG